MSKGLHGSAKRWTKWAMFTAACALAACQRSETPPSPAATGTTRQAVRLPLDGTADVLLGQPRFDVNAINGTDGKSMASPSSLALDHSVSPPRLYLADMFNNRVLAWNDAASYASGASADLVIGHVSFEASLYAGGDDWLYPFGQDCNGDPTDQRLCRPQGVLVDTDGNLYVADTNHNRVLYFTTPFSTDTTADRVYGQTAFNTFQCNRNATTPSATTLCGPVGLSLDAAGNLYVGDRDNHRVLRYNAPLTETTADVVLGQTVFDRREPNVTDTQGMRLPTGMAVDTSTTPNRIWVVDKFNHRVLGYNTVAFANGAPATVVLGIPHANNAVCTTVTRSASTLCNPSAVAVDAAGNVFVADGGNNRVLGYLNPFGTDGVADQVFGQTGFTTATTGNGATNLNAPQGVLLLSSGSLLVADTFNSRIFRYDPAGAGLFDNSTPTITTDNRNPDFFYGQAANSGATNVLCNRNTESASAAMLCFPWGLAQDAAGNIYVADFGNSRVLEFNASPADATADRVFGQPNMVSAIPAFQAILSGAAGTAPGLLLSPGVSQHGRRVAPCGLPTASNLCHPQSVSVAPDGTVWVADSGKGRVVGYTNPLTTDQVADRVLGRPDLGATECSDTSSSCFEGIQRFMDTDPVGRDQFFLNDQNPIFELGVTSDAAGNVYVSVADQNRVLRFNDPSGAGDTAADTVLGQPDMTSKAPNAAEALSLNQPLGVFVDTASSPGRLLVADFGNNRVQVWSSVDALSNGKPADLALGQVAPNGATRNRGGLGGGSLAAPAAVAGDGAGNIYVADSGNSRVLKYTTPFSTDLVADQVFGQATPAVGECNAGGQFASASALCTPLSVSVSGDANTLWVADNGNHRILRYDGASADRVADVVLGQPDMAHKSPNWTSADSIFAPESVAIDRSVSPNRLYVADRALHRIVAWNNIETVGTGQPPDLIIGQPNALDDVCNNGGISARTLCDPSYVRVDAQGNLWVADTRNNRVLRYLNPFGTDTQADLVLGQPDFVSSAINGPGGTASASSFYFPHGLDLDAAGNLWVADLMNHRVLYFANPVTTDKTADQVLGQPDLVSNQCNQGFNTPSQNRVCKPRAVRIDATVTPYSVWVADSFNDRLLRFDDPTNDRVADQLLGRSSPTAWTERRLSAGSNSQSATRDPIDIAIDDQGSVYIAEDVGDRIMVYTTPRTTDVVADRVFGQVAFNRGSCNITALVSSQSVCHPFGLDLDEYGGLWVADKVNSRVIAYLANTKPTATLQAVSPATPLTSNPLVATYVYADPDLDLEGGTVIRWYRNGVEVTGLADPATVPAAATAKGEVWHFTVRPRDGIQFGAMVTSAPVTIQNTPPAVSALSLTPASPLTADELDLSYAWTDDDLGDAESGTQIRWFKNNNEQTALRDQKKVNPLLTAKGDIWFATVTPSDGTSFSAVVTSPAVAIGNSSPAAASPQILPAVPRVANDLTATWEYTDGDDDAETAPEIRWFRNGLRVAALDDAPTVPGPLTFNDSWFFTLRPRDGSAFGAAVTSPTVTVVSTPPTASVLQITPTSPRTGDALTANYLYDDVDGQLESGSDIHWVRNGVEVPTLTGATTVPATETARGDSWHFTVRPGDGALLGATQTSAPVVIGNSPPSASNAAVTPATPGTSNTLTASYTYADADGDTQGASELRWFKNGVEQDALLNAPSVPPSATTKREVWYFEVRPHDGTAFGVAEPSAPVLIANSPPVANAGPDLDPTPMAPTTRVTLDAAGSSDLDNDVLQYTWREGSTVVGTGVTVNLDLPLGTYTYTLSVTDGETTTTDDVVVTVGDPRPSVTVPASFQTAPGPVTLAATASDPLGRVLSYQWSQTGGPTVDLVGAQQPEASFFALADGTYAFTLVVSAAGGSNPSNPAAVAVTIQNLAPVAQVPQRATTQTGVALSVDGRGSSDPNGSPVTYQWTVLSGPGTATLTDATQPVAELTASAGGTYVLELVVSDGTLSSAPRTTQVLVLDPTVTNNAPVAVATAPATADAKTLIRLDGTRSYDVDGSRLTFAWRQTAGPTVALATPTAAQASFTPATAGTYTFALRASDGATFSPDAVVSVTVLNTASNPRPVARVTSVTTATVGTSTALDGTRSSDPAGDPITYAWTQLEGVPVQLLGATSATASFVPIRPGAALFQLVVSDGTFSSEPSLQTVLISSPGNAPPVANAGADTQAIAGTVVQLDATGSTDPNGDALHYVWEQTHGPPAVLSGPASAPQFTARGTKEIYRFRLTAWDAESPSAPDEVEVAVVKNLNNQAPLANAGAGQEAAANSAVQLDGRASTDPEQDALSYHWELVGFPTGAEIQLENNGTSTPSFTPTVAGAYSFALVVNDGDLSSAPAFVSVVVTGADGGQASGCQSSGGADSTSLWALLLALAWAARTLRRSTTLMSGSMRASLTVVAACVVLSACKPNQNEAKPPELAASRDAVRAPRDGVADLVLGQSRFTVNAINNTDASSLAIPGEAALDTRVSPPRLYVADTGNNRVLAWNDATAFSLGAPADLIFGFTEPDLNSTAFAGDLQRHPDAVCVSVPSSQTLCRPTGVAVDGAGTLYVADSGNHRILGFTDPFNGATPLSARVSADRVLGQPHFAADTCNQGGTASATTLCTPTSVGLDSAGNLYAVDSSNHRVLRFNATPVDDIADIVLGQPGFTLSDPNLNDARGMRNPARIAVDTSVTPNRLWVAEVNNHRVLGFPTVDFADGDPATVVLGQATMNAANNCNADGSPTAATLCRPTAVAVDPAGNVYVADSGNDRVLGYLNPFAGGPDATVADKVWGQTSMTVNVAEASANGLFSPQGLAVTAAGDLLVADTGNDRVVRYLIGAGPLGLMDPTTDVTADAVYGQPTMDTGACNIGGRSASSLCRPISVAEDSGWNIYVADATNNRVVVYEAGAGPSVPDKVADRAIGQASLTLGECNGAGPGGNTNVVSAATLCEPHSVVVSGGTLWVSDAGNGRVLGYTAPLTTDLVADRVLGRPDFGTTACTGTSASCFEGNVPAWTRLMALPDEGGALPASSFSTGVAADASGNLYVAVSDQHRVLRFDDPATLDAAADRVLGQPDFTSRQMNFAEAGGMQSPVGLFVDRSFSPNRLLVADASANRVLVWSSVAVVSGQPADRVIGQPNLNAAGAGLGPSGLSRPTHLSGDSTGNLYVVDSNNNRVLRFDTPFTTDFVADAVFGQADFVSGACNRGATSASASSLCTPSGAIPLADGTRLWVVDQGNHRVLRYDGPSTDKTADGVLGQASDSHRALNRMGPESLAWLQSVAIDRSVSPNRVYVADRGLHRVLGWASIEALSNGQPADLILGQPTAFEAVCNNGGISASTLCEPSYVRVDATGRVWVADTGNHRVLAFAAPFSNDKTADFVLGQNDFSSGGANGATGMAGASTFSSPRGLDIDASGNVWVADHRNNRVLYFADPTGTDRVADQVLGQADMTSTLCNRGANPNATTLCGPYAVRPDPTASPSAVYVADFRNQRVLRYDDPLTTNTTADQVLLRTNFTEAASPPITVISPSIGYEPSDLAVDTLGNLYVSEATSDRVIVFNTPRTTDAAGDQLFLALSYARADCNLSGRASASNGCRPLGLDFDEFGGLWVADSGNSRVLAFLANTVPTVSAVAMVPAAPVTNDTLTAAYAYADVESDPELGTEIRWYKDGVEQVAFLNAASIPAANTARGEVWRFTVRPRDGIQFGAVTSSPLVTIANTRPVVANVVIAPAAPKTGDALSVSYGWSDSDSGDTDTGTELRWFIGGVEQVALRNQTTVDASVTSKDQLWTVMVTPKDGFDLGTPVTSAVVQIQNTQPSASSPQVLPAVPVAANSLTASWSYADPDDDPQTAAVIEWFKNGVRQPALDNEVRVLGPLTYQDTWYFTLRPRDGQAVGALVTSPTVTVVSTPPTASALQIAPFAPTTASTLTANYLYEDADTQTESGSEIRWYRNAVEVASVANQTTVPAALTSRGETWHFTVRPKDGVLFGTLRTSPSIVIGNTAPTATAAAITPATPNTDSVLAASYSFSDADGDTQGTTTIRWFRNGVEQSSFANAPSIPAAATSKGQVWQFRVKPHDGAVFGEEVTSASVFIGNSAPVADAGPDQVLTPTGATTRVTLTAAGSTDADADLLDYTWLKGSTVIATGVNPEVELSPGLHTITLSANDGEVSDTDTVLINLGDPQPTAVAPADFTALPGKVTLSGSGSDPLGRGLSYAWSQTSGPPVDLVGADQATASFFGIGAGPRTFQLVVTAQDSASPSSPDPVTVTTQDLAPLAATPARVIAKVGTAVSIGSDGSSDPNGAALGYQWTVQSGPGTATLSGETQATLQLTAPADGTYLVSLVVTDGALSSPAALVEVVAVDSNVVDHAPVALASAPASGEVGAEIALDGTRSYDLDSRLGGDELKYAWTQSSGPTVTISQANQASARFVPSTAGTYVFELSVQAGTQTSAAATVSVNVLDTAGNARPIARVTSVTLATVGVLATLDGTRSSDPAGEPIAHAWTQVGGVPVQLANGTSPTASFLPLRPGVLTFELTVSDGTHPSVPVTQLVLVSSPANSPPTANAGADLRVIPDRVVTLDASASTDADGNPLRYVWEQTHGTPVALTVSGATATFTPRSLGIHRFRLTAWDGESASAVDEIDVVVGRHDNNNKAPVASISTAGSALIGEQVSLDGSASSDEDALDLLTYRWRVVGFPTGFEPSLSNASTATPSFTATSAGTYSFALVVSDGELSSAPSYVSVTVSDPTGGKAQGCSATGQTMVQWPLAGLALLGLIRGRRRRQST